MTLTKEQKKALMNAWKEKQKKAYILKKREAKSLFTHITRQLAKTPCDHTLTHARAWLEKKFPDGARHDAIIREWQEDGGGCDCEIILNCYERYELDG